MQRAGMYSVIFLGIGIGLASCVTTTTAQDAPLRPFPDGVYGHHVEFAHQKTGNQIFDGLMTIRDGRVQFVLLSPFATTMARISDSLAADQPEIRLYDPSLQSRPEEVRRAYLAIKPALVHQNVSHLTRPGFAASVHQTVVGTGLPAAISIVSSDFQIKIQVVKR